MIDYTLWLIVSLGLGEWLAIGDPDKAQRNSHFLVAPEVFHIGNRVGLNRAPLRSRIGHFLAARSFKWIWGSDIKDTQSGLRVIPQALFRPLMELPQQRYDWELAVLGYCIKSGQRVHNTPIQALYFDNNKTSHFRPLLDSIIIAKTILKR